MAVDGHGFRPEGLYGHGGRAAAILRQQADHFHICAGAYRSRHALEPKALQQHLRKELRVGKGTGTEAQRIIQREIDQQAHGLVVADAKAAVVHMHAQLLGQFLLGIGASHHRRKQHPLFPRPA